MRDLINLVNGAPKPGSMLKLMEGRNYDEMFERILKVMDMFGERKFYEEAFAEDIKWAKQNLKRFDRITWYLRIARYVVTMKYYLDGVVSKKLDATKEQEEALVALVKELGQGLNFNTYDMSNMVHDRGMQSIRANLIHYLGMNIPEIEETRLGFNSPNELFQRWGNIEDRWKREQNQHLQIQNGEKVIVQFNDGFAWFDLNVPNCDYEATAMGHCGNRGGNGGDRLLSLRKKVQQGKQTMWRPSLTFVLNEEGYLTEMKGRGNDKPAAKYHSYIIELLKHPMVEGIIGGGYLPENNFSMNDLTPEQRQELYGVKPALMTAADYYEYNDHQIDPHLARLAYFEVVNHGLDVEGFTTHADRLTLYEFDSIHAAGIYLGDFTFSTAHEAYKGTENELKSPMASLEGVVDKSVLYQKVLDAILPERRWKIAEEFGNPSNLAEAIVAYKKKHGLTTPLRVGGRGRHETPQTRLIEVLDNAFYQGWRRGVQDALAADITSSIKNTLKTLVLEHADQAWELTISVEHVVKLIADKKLPYEWTNLEEQTPTIPRLKGVRQLGGLEPYINEFNPHVAHEKFENECYLETDLHKATADRWAKSTDGRP